MKQYAEVSRNNAGSRTKRVAIRLAIAAAALTSLPAFATLGENSASVTADKLAMQATLATSTKVGYTDYALTLANGIVVHEFVNATNQVFEVTWNGKGMRPDMKQILGNYFQHFGVQEKERRPLSRHADRIGTNFAFHSEVHNRWFSGTAHVPSMMPSTLSGPLAVPESAAASAIVAPAASVPGNSAH